MWGVVWNNQYFEKFATTRKIIGAPNDFITTGLYMHIAPSSDCSLLTLNLI